jgi:ABC-type transport system involved in multi-copper enzyme maturation permease subunit
MMTFLPVVAREMNVLARRRSTYMGRAGMALTGVLVMAWLLATASSAVSAAGQGKAVFAILSSLGFGFALLAGVLVTADCLSEEKREGTLGLLFLTDLKGYDIVLGKMAATSLGASYALMGVVPVLALAMFLGGVSLAQVGGAALVLASTMFLSLSLGVLVSSLSTNERKAMLAAIVGIGGLTFGPYMIGMALYSGNVDQMPAKIGFVSPLYAFLCVYAKGPGGLDPRFFWWSLGAQFALACAFLFAAGRILPRCVSELPSTRFQKLRALGHWLSFGNRGDRKRHRAALLDRNAFLWLASRERLKPRYAWLVVGLFGGIYAWILIQFTDLLYDLGVALAILFLIHLTFKLWTASEVCSRLIQDRRSGALELLLSSPLSVREIARGQTLALRRIFFRPVSVLILAEIVLMHRMLNQPRSMVNDPTIIWSFIAAITTLIVDLWALKWVGLWLSLRGKSIERVLLGTTARVMALPWLLFIAFAGLMLASQILTGQRGFGGTEALRSWWLISIGAALAFALPARFRFLRSFREEATRRFDNPPEFKEVPAAAPAIRHRAPRRRFARFAWPAVALLLIGGPSARRYYWQKQIDREVRTIAAEGLPTSEQELARFYQPVPASENSIAAVQAAGTINLGVFGRRMSMNYGLSGVTPISGELRGKFEETVKLNQAQLAAYRAGLSLTNAYLQPATGMALFANNLPPHAAVAWMEGMVAVENGEWDRAVESVLNLLRFAERLRRLPVVHAQTTCAAALEHAGHILERLLFRHQLDADSLLRIQEQSNRINGEDVLRRQLVVRRAMLLNQFRAPAADPMGMMGPPNPALAAFNALNSGIGSRDRGYFQVLQAYRKSFAAAKSPAPERFALIADLDRVVMDGLVDIPVFLRQMYALHGLFQFDAAITARVRVLQSALAAERYSLEKGKPPATLEALVPEFLPGAPLDPFSGTTLNLKPDGAALKIYSVGTDRVDDGGKMGNHSKGDIVFSRWSRAE